MKNNILNKAFVPLIISALILLILASLFMMNPYLWFDEAGQFWIAKGLNHDSNPLSKFGGLFDVIENNKYYNLDPGLFGILLHYWSMVSNNYIWLRLLPFIFFLLICISFYYLSYQWTSNKQISSLMCIVPFIYAVLYNMSSEIRAYSMEALGVLSCIIAIDNLQKKVTIKKLISWSLCIALFIGTRYSFIIVAFVTSTYIIYIIFKSNFSNRKKILMIILYSIPLLIALVYDYFFAMKYQNPDAQPLHYLPYLSNVIFTDKAQLLNVESLLYIFSIIVIIWISYHFRENLSIKKLYGLVYVTIVTNILFFILSFLGKHPWTLEQRCISMITLVVLCYSAFSSILLSKYSQSIGLKYLYLIFFSFIFIGEHYIDIKTIRHGRKNTLTEYMLISNRNGNKYVDRWESPCLRYQYEYGQLYGLDNYPENFTFVKYRCHNAIYIGQDTSLNQWYETTQPELNELSEFDILIAPELARNKPKNNDLWVSINNTGHVWIKK